jgi:hypothetical protein
MAVIKKRRVAIPKSIIVAVIRQKLGITDRTATEEYQKTLHKNRDKAL